MTVAAAGALVLGLASAPATAAPSAAECAKPALREAMVSQGLPSYRSLVRDRETMVKLFLSQQYACSATITVRSGTLRTVIDGVQYGEIPIANVNAFVSLPSWSVAPVPDSNSDPYFIVPGSTLTPTFPAPPLTGYDVRFDIRLVYDAAVGTTKFPDQVIDLVTPVRRVERAGQPLRILAVPMGDADKGYGVVFPPGTDAVLRSSMQTMQRVLPVGDGIGTIESETGGLRYTVAPSQQLVDLGPHLEPTTGSLREVNYLDSNGLFCGDGVSYPYVQSELAEARTLWNSVRPPSQHADLVLGVIAQSLSRGPSTGDPSCADGYAGVGRPEAWYRLVSEGTAPRGGTAPFLAGYIGALETGHTFGAVVGAKANGYHSSADQSDATAPDRAYNVARRQYRPDDRSVMKYSPSSGHDDNVLLEARDWDLVHCVLTAAAAGALCPTAPVALGATSAAGGALHLSGSTDGTAERTFVHSYVTSGRDEQTTSTGPYFVRFYDVDRELLRERALPVSRTRSHHTGEDGHQHGDGEVDVFDSSVDATGAHSFALVRRDASGETVLYERHLDGRPVIEEVRRGGGARTAWAATAGDDLQPDVTADGELVAWSDDAGLKVRRAVDAVGPAGVAEGGRLLQPDWHGRKLAAVTPEGSVVVLEVDSTSSTEPPRVTMSHVVYEADGSAGRPPASDPSWSPDGGQLVVAVGGTSLRVLDASPGAVVDCLTAAGCRTVLIAPGVSNPSWSPQDHGGSGAGLIAYEQAPLLSGDEGATTPVAPGTPAVYTVDPGATVPVPVQRVLGTAPAWADGRLYYATPSGIASVSAPGFDDPEAETDSPGDARPSASADGSVLAVEGPSADGDDVDVFLSAPLTEERFVVATDDSPDDLRLDVLLSCPDGLSPAASALFGRRVEDRVVFEVTLDESAACPGGLPVFRVADGWQTASHTEQRPLTGRLSGTVSVTSPRPGDVFGEAELVPLDLDGWDAHGQATDADWRIDGPQERSGTSSSGRTVDVKGLPAGTYLLTAAVDGSSVTVPFTVVPDPDRDGLWGDADEPPPVNACYPDDAPHNAINAVTDYDHDFKVGRADPDPCTSAFTAAVTFEPQTVLLGSQGTPLTLTITLPFSADGLTASQIRLTSMAGRPVDLASYAIAAVDGRVVTAKFDRPTYSSTARALGLLSGFVPVVVTVDGASGRSSGADLRYPVHTT